MNRPRSRYPLALVWLAVALPAWIVVTPSVATPADANGEWIELSPTGTAPGARSRHTGIYDPLRHRVVYFGGSPSAEVWALSLGGTMAWSNLAPSPGPAARGLHVAIYDPTGDRMIVQGGFGGGGETFSDTWALSLSGTPTWTQLSLGANPGQRVAHVAVYDSRRQRMVLFGGLSGQTDVWVLPLADPTPTWEPLTVPGSDPAARLFTAAAYDSANDRMLLVFGATGGSSLTNQTWALSFTGTPAWSLLPATTPPPVGLYGHSVVIDPVRSRAVVWGGQLANYSNSAFGLPLVGPPAWSLLAPSGTPPSTRNFSPAVYDPVGDRMVVFGGTNESGDQPDTWALVWATPTPVLLSALRAEMEPDGARITWYAADERGFVATVERTTDGFDWRAGGEVAPDGAGWVVYRDRDVEPGVRYGYRLRVPTEDGPGVFGEIWLEVPEAVLALAVRSPSARGGLRIDFRLATADPAVLESFDVRGRREWERSLTGLGPGAHHLEISPGGFPSGLHFLRLRQGRAMAGARAVVLP